MKKISFGVFALAVILGLTNGAIAAPTTSRDGYVWENSIDISEWEMKTFAWEDTNVYAEPDLKSKIVGKLKKTPPGKNDVTIVQARAFVKRAPNGNFEEMAKGGWWRISSPVKGWVELSTLGKAESDLFVSFFY